MNDIVYVPIIKTGDAEIRGLENLSEKVKSGITPLFELTRSRKSKNLLQGDIFRRLERLQEIYGKRQFILDLTGDPVLTNKQIEILHNSNEGYLKWIKFLTSIKEFFPKIIPTVQISDEGVDNIKDFYERIEKQVGMLGEHFKLIAYRFPLEYDDYQEDLRHICNAVSGGQLVCIVDAGFITQEKSSVYAQKAISVLNGLSAFSLGRTVLTATSFPRNPIQFGAEEEGEFNLEECLLYQRVSKVHSKLIYGDYATINPIRVLQAGGNGWVPRIDMPTEENIYYRRSRRGEFESNYASAYTRVASRVRKHIKYKQVTSKINDCWGIEQIELAAGGQPEGLSPSFWISVRMNIHMTLRLALI